MIRFSSGVGRSKAALTALVATLLVAGVAGCGDDESGANVNSQGLDANGCKPAERPPAKDVQLAGPKRKLDRAKTYVAVFKTNCGDFSVTLDVKRNPRTAASVAYLVENGVYDNTWFHRIVPDFVIQGGDPRGDGTGDAGYKVTERPKGDYQLNTVAMAKGGDEAPGTSGSQFYIVTGASGTTLPPDYAIAGKVTEGEDTLRSIAGYAGAPGDQSGTPSGVALIYEARLETK